MPVSLFSAEGSLGSFSNDDADGIENVKTTIGLFSKTTTLHVDHAFLFLNIALPSLHDYDGKMPNFAFYGDVNNRQPNFLSLSKLECDPQEINSREICLH